MYRFTILLVNLSNMNSIALNQHHDHLLKLINQVFELERKTNGKNEFAPLSRNINRMKDTLNEMGYQWANPIGEPYNDTRTDCEASIAGESSENLVITEVLKPIVWIKENGMNFIVQKAVVIAESKK